MRVAERSLYLECFLFHESVDVELEHHFVELVAELVVFSVQREDVADKKVNCVVTLGSFAQLGFGVLRCESDWQVADAPGRQRVLRELAPKSCWPA